MKTQHPRILVHGALAGLAVAAVNAHAQAAPAPIPAPVAAPPPVAVPATPAELEPFAAPGAPAPTAPAPLSPVEPPVAAPITPAVSPVTAPALTEPPIIPVTPATQPPAILAPVASVAGPAGQSGRITGTRVNARGKSTIFSHPVFQFQKGEPVNVLEEISLATPKAGEPRKWLRIQVPGDVGLWVHSSFIDPKTSTVKATRLNVRSGPGDNFPILCRLPQGTQLRATPNKVENWQEILAPPQSSVYVAAQFVALGGPAEATPSVITVPGAQPTAATTVAPATPQGPPANQNITVPLHALTRPKVENVTPATTPAPPIPIKANPLAGLKNPPAKGGGNPVTPPSGEGSQPEGTAVAKPVPTQPAKPDSVDPKGGDTSKPANTAETQPDPGNKPETQQDQLATNPAKEEPQKTDIAKEKPTWIQELLAKSTKPDKPVKVEPLPGTENENLPVRIVRREGVLQRTFHIQAPSPFVLENLETGKTMNFLYTANTRIPDALMKQLRGRHVVVTGEEAIEPRWKKTPMLIIQTIKTLDSIADNN